MLTATAPALRSVTATRYVTPLREGGSLPGLVEADDDGLYVVKFRGAGQGPRALVAEIVVGELARALGLPVPELVLVELDPELGRAEPDPEIQELIAASAGPNLGVDFLPGALPFTRAAAGRPTRSSPPTIVWLDALVTNVDRTRATRTCCVWHGAAWLIDHGAALYRQHAAGRDPPATPAAVPADRRPRAAAVRRLDPRGRRAPGAAARRARCSSASWRSCPRDGSRGRRARPTSTTSRGRLAAPRTFADEAERARRA